MGGVSTGPWRSFNLADHVGDDPLAVAANRRMLQRALDLETPPLWLQQVHGIDVIFWDGARGGKWSPPPCADASFSRTPGLACVVMTADCLPVLFCDPAGTTVAAAHAGWRGLAGGVLRATVAAMGVEPGNVLAWLGPAISQAAFEVGAEVAEVFAANGLSAAHRDCMAECFRPSANPGKFLADLYGLARAELRALGVRGIYGGDFCTFREKDRFYSYRRDGETGRMASLIWIAGS